MKNKEFHKLLRWPDKDQKCWKLSQVAAAINCGVSHVNRVVNNHTSNAGQQFGADYGSRTRPKLVAFFREHFAEEEVAAMLAALGWDGEGKRVVVPRGTCHVAHIDAKAEEPL